MKLFSKSAPPASVVEAAFTITEMMVSVAIFMMVIAGVIYSHIVGLKMYNITKSKLGASDQARAALGTMIAEIRSAKMVRVGNGTLSSFSEVANGAPEQGNCVQINTTTNTNTFIRYYFDTNDAKLKRTQNGVTGSDIVAEFVTNKVIFAVEDYQGNVLTNDLNNRVISLTLQFYQIQYPIVKIGSNQVYDFYQIRTKITRRTLE